MWLWNIYVHFKTLCSNVVWNTPMLFGTQWVHLYLQRCHSDRNWQRRRRFGTWQSSSQNDLKVNKSVAKRHMRIQYSTALCKVCNIYIYVNYVEAVKHLPAAQKAHFETVKVPVQLLSQWAPPCCPSYHGHNRTVSVSQCAFHPRPLADSSAVSVDVSLCRVKSHDVFRVQEAFCRLPTLFGCRLV